MLVGVHVLVHVSMYGYFCVLEYFVCVCVWCVYICACVVTLWSALCVVDIPALRAVYCVLCVCNTLCMLAGVVVNSYSFIHLLGIGVPEQFCGFVNAREVVKGGGPFEQLMSLAERFGRNWTDGAFSFSLGSSRQKPTGGEDNRYHCEPPSR